MHWLVYQLVLPEAVRLELYDLERREETLREGKWQGTRRKARKRH